ncbi:MAG TPA: hypothetical protein VN418_04855 [Gammaproteobacteria bacterium]|nr:hypothetical protein [Gammaproteobacteria bacterium]
MAKCVTPCDTSEDGICVIRGSVATCDPVSNLKELATIISTADKVCFIPDDKLFTVEAVKALAAGHKGLRFTQRKDGAIEISKS